MLRVVTVPIVSNEKCKKIYHEFIVNERNICAGVREGGKDSCQVNKNKLNITVKSSH